MTPPSAGNFVLRSLYRSLLRAAAPFSAPSPAAAAYASLIHRSGVAHDWEGCVRASEDRRRRAAAAAARDGDEDEGGEKEIALPRSWARNLSRSYSDLREEYSALRKDYLEQRYGHYGIADDGDWDDDDETAMDLAAGSSSSGTSSEGYVMDEDPKFVLFRQLLREWFTASGGCGGDANADDCAKEQWPKEWTPNESGFYENRRIRQVPLTRFPSQVNASPSLRSFIRSEFRAPTVDERLRMESKREEEASTRDVSNGGRRRHAPRPATSKGKIYPSSSFIDNETRMQTAFYTLNELNRKLFWAEKIGFPPHPPHQKATVQERKWKRLVQAAKGVTRLSRNAPANETEKAISEEELPTKNADEDNRNAALDDDGDGSIEKSSHPIQRGTYLISHPMMTGYFAKSVISLLDHEEGSSGGTYGVIVNRLALQPETADPSLQRQQREVLRQNWEEERKKSRAKEVGLRGNEASSEHTQMADSTEGPRTADAAATPSPGSSARSTVLKRPISLSQAIQDLPEVIQMAFGDSPVRQGGPLNASVQMIHRRAPEVKKTSDDLESVPNTEKGGEGKCSKIGGTPISGAEQRVGKPKDPEETIFFNGNVLEASYEVLDGRSDRDDFSFLIGASCWAPGQLVNEIDSGCWLTFNGPPQMAMTGMVDHDDVAGSSSSDSEGNDAKGAISTGLPSSNAAIALASQQQSSQPAMRPVGNLWLSIMCALGESEADLAYMLLDSENVKDPLGDACDNFGR